MNKLRLTLFKSMTIFLCLITTGVYSQKQTKTFYETFTTNAETVLDINTTHSDIEFETWNKKEVSIEAIVEFEDATDEEIKNYLKRNVFEILGNSKKVSIKTGVENSWITQHVIDTLSSHNIGIHVLPQIDSLHFMLSDIDSLPPIPNFKVFKFDHEAYDKEGDKYMKEWQKRFSKGFDEDYKKRLEVWTKKIEEGTAKRSRALSKYEKRRAKLVKEREKLREERKKTYEVRRNHLIERRNTIRNSRENKKIIINTNEDDEPSVFFFSLDRKIKNYKVKKTIKIKMPKGMKIQMNVRHGEVKLAAATKNLNAIISHSSLWAGAIDGDKTEIKASYSPVNIEKWNFGQLQVNYSDAVDLKEVGNLRLTSTSSAVTINRLLHNVYAKSNFGPLNIKSVANSFSDIDISVQNGEVVCKLPDTPFAIYINETDSEFKYPSKIVLNSTKNHNTTIHKGYYGVKNSNKAIRVNTKYSEVILK